MFASREDAGLKLGRCLQDQGVRADLVLGLPRGGVVVAAKVARALHLPLDVLLVRKIGHPRQREFAVGALAENGVTVLDEDVIWRERGGPRGAGGSYRRGEGAAAQLPGPRFIPRALRFSQARPCCSWTMVSRPARPRRRRCLSARKQNALSIVVAAPVASTQAVERLARVADEVRVLQMDPDFEAVGRYYDVFAQTTDEEVLELLRET